MDAPRSVPAKTGEVDFRRLKWLAILAPLVFIGILEYARYALAPVLASWRGHLLMNLVVLIGMVFFYGAVFSTIDHMRRRLERQNRELVALRRAGLDIVSELSLDVVLEKMVHHACELLDCRYGALAVYHDDGSIHHFVTAGIEQADQEKIGPLPTGNGVLGIVLHDAEHLRLDELAAHPRSCGFPEHHPAMSTLLAVPVICRSPCRGNLYVSEKHDGRPFSQEEEAILVRFAAQAAIAIDNAHLHKQVATLAVAEERLRLAREMHDGQAQVLAYVNTQAQVVREHLRRGREEQAGAELDQLASAAREVYADVREGILGLRTMVDAEHDLSVALREHLDRWRDQCGISAELALCPLPPLPPDVELQLLRIVQEALANVRKHARPQTVSVSLRRRDTELIVTIEDDGRGFDPTAIDRRRRPRFGLATMRERAEAIGARLDIDSEPQRGTRVELTLPLDRPSSIAPATLAAARDAPFAVHADTPPSSQS